MFKLKFVTFFLLIATNISLVHAANPQNQSTMVYCDPQLKSCFKRLEQLPEIKELITKVVREGPIHISVKETRLSQQFGAFWDPDRRAIFVDPSSSQGELIGSIIFELHNALRNSDINNLHQLASSGEIDRESYIQGIERLEYENSLSASKIAEKGIKLKIFPPSACLQTYKDFEEHYRMQKFGGHSAWIGFTYDELRR